MILPLKLNEHIEAFNDGTMLHETVDLTRGEKLSKQETLHVWNGIPKQKKDGAYELGVLPITAIEEIRAVKTGEMTHSMSIRIGEKELTLIEMAKYIANNDHDFSSWREKFFASRDDFQGMIIHWTTEIRYDKENAIEFYTMVSNEE